MWFHDGKKDEIDVIRWSRDAFRHDKVGQNGSTGTKFHHDPDMDREFGSI